MKIHSVKYYDKHREWGYDSIGFSDLTLLVGVSGAGKTQILSSLNYLKLIASGNSLNARGVAWEISFSNDNTEYFWAGEFDVSNAEDYGQYNTGKLKIIKEVIRTEGKEIARRNEKEIYFEDNKMPKLAVGESLVSILREEEDIRKAFEGFEKIKLRDYTIRDIQQIRNTYQDDELSKIKSNYQTLEQIKESNLDIPAKLYCLYENQPKSFLKIKERFIDVFQQTEDIEIRISKSPHFQHVTLFIKERGVKQWINQLKISSGMFRTFLHISQMYLLKKGSVVLIDEFENSLGINCINVLAEDLMFENNDIQFIITSHHPYIINQIPYEYWKIVTRENGKIVTYDAEEFNLGESHHERFMNLINLPKYKKGIVHA